MASTFKLIEATTLTTTQASVTFSIIPATFTDLCIKTSLRCGSTGVQIGETLVSFNSNSTNQASKRIFAYILGEVGQTRTDLLLGNLPSVSNLANTFSNDEATIFNYAGSNNKTANFYSAADSTNTDTYSKFLNITGSRWSNVSPIHSVTFTSNADFQIGSSFYLYGISNS